MHSRLGIYIFFYQVALAFFCQMQDQIGMGFTRKFMTRELSADSLPSMARFSMLSIYVVKQVSTTFPFSLTTFIGIRMKPDTHECSRRAHNSFESILVPRGHADLSL
jgi:hypothetical protein